MSGGRDNILAFLQEAELAHYYSALAHDLRVTSVNQIKYVEDEDLADIGMSKPEMRRLRKFYNKACPKGFGKLKKILTTKSGGQDSPPPEVISPYPRSPHIARSLAEPGHMILPDTITAYKTLGEGQFATVQQGIWTTDSNDRVQVALKRIHSGQMQTSTGEFVREAGELILSGSEHIVQLYGVVVQPDTVMLVMELAPLRSLHECLKEPSLRSTFTVSLLCEFALQVAEGMAFLESKSLVHRDLAARNVLVFTKDKVKVGDYGLTKALGVGAEHYQTNLSLYPNLPMSWCAPECIHQTLFTSASDVWAYGVTLWEMFSFGFQPWAAFTGEQVLAAIDEPSCQRLEQPDACPSGHYTLMGQCWNHHPDLRPKFSLISDRLHQIKPERVEALTDSSGLLKQDQLILKCHDVVTVLDKQPCSAPSPGMWKGVMDSGKVGYFEPILVGPCVEMRNGSPAHRTRSTKLTRKESARKSMSKGGGVKKLSASMISGPKSDLRHTGHIGYDGAVFGDVSFIGNNYDKLPVRVGSTYAPSDEMSGSTISLPVTEKDRASLVASTQARLSYLSTNSNDADSVNTRLSDSDTLTDVSSMVDDADGMQRCRSEEGVLDHTVTHSASQPFDDFGDLKMPDFSGELGLDFGSSFMDEVMKALDDKPPQSVTTSPPRIKSDAHSEAPRHTQPNKSDARPEPVRHTQPTKSDARPEPARHTQPTKAEDTFITDKSPLLEISKPMFGDVGSTFDNVALASEDCGDEDDRLSSGTRGSYGSQLKDSGIMEASFASVEISDYSKLSDESPSREEERKKVKPKLKLIMPSRGEASKKEGIQPMSASDEKILNEAIELANEFAHRQNAENMSPAVTDSQERLSATPGSTDGADFLDSSWGSTSKFGVRKKSPKQEKRTFTEEIASRPHDMNEELTAEAQEAYNMLVVKGTKERDSFKAIRERRSQRGMLFNSQDSEADKSAHTALSARNGRQVNMNIRKPQGIPTRAGVGPRGVTVEAATDDQDTNPLRRLRDSQSSVTSKSRLSSRSELVNGQGDSVHHANLNPNLSFFAKLKEQEMANGKQEGSNHVASNPIPVPPRVPLRSSTINAKPRERIHMLDLGTDQATNSDKAQALDSQPVYLSSSQTEQKHRRSGDDSVFTESKSCFVFPGGQPLSPVSPLGRPFSLSSIDSAVSMNVKSVTASAHELGIDDNSDTFWLQKINFEEMVVPDFDRAMVEDENAPIPGRYKTSDAVSYEDIMEFALDGPNPRDMDFNTLCDQVRLMRRVLSKDITVEDCMCALEDTDREVHSAIKLLKLKQLLSTGLGDQERCKSALMRSMWSINEAANYLLAISSGSDSPDLVHV